MKQDDAAGIERFRIIAMRDGILGGMVGVADWDGARLNRAREMALYDFGDRATMMEKRTALKGIGRTGIDEVDAALECDVEVVLGEGMQPPANRSVVKYRVFSEHGFGKSPLTVFDRAVEAIRAGDMTADVVPQRGGGGGEDAGKGAGLSDPDDDIPALGAWEDEAEDEFGPTHIPTLPASPRIISAEAQKSWTLTIKVDIRRYHRRSKNPDKFIVMDGKVMQGYEWVEPHSRGKDKEDRAERDRRRREESAARLARKTLQGAD